MNGEPLWFCRWTCSIRLGDIDNIFTTRIKTKMEKKMKNLDDNFILIISFIQYSLCVDTRFSVVVIENSSSKKKGPIGTPCSTASPFYFFFERYIRYVCLYQCLRVIRISKITPVPRLFSIFFFFHSILSCGSLRFKL